LHFILSKTAFFLAKRINKEHIMKIHVVSETKYMAKGNGVHTAFIDHVELLKTKNDVEVVINNEGKGDVYHSHTYGPFYFLKGLGYRGRRIHTVHVIPNSIKGSLPMSSKLMPFVRWYLKKVYNFADVCIAISPMVEEAIKETGAKTEIVRIFNPINPQKWERTDENRKKGRELLEIDENEFVVLGVGQLQARKGVEDFIDISAAIPNAKFVWAGGRPFKAMTEGIARIDARMASATNNTQFTGVLDLDEMPIIYAAADLLLFTSYQENCPLAPIEAAACGIPVVFRNIIEYKKLYDCTYLKANGTADFISITKKLIEDDHSYELGVEISRQLIKQFDKDKIRGEMVNLYTRLSE
jgi:1,2-diacylglycerol-3-alpha-glucose alpha-1,2-galactosyltransferase